MLKLDNNHKGIIGTVLFHGLLLLCFFFMGFKTPLPLPEEIGTEIDMGGGGGGSSEAAETTPTPSTEDEYATQNSEDNNSITKTNVKKTKTETKETQPEVNKLLLYKKGSNTNGNGTGTGSGNGSGVGSGNGSGSGTGDGPGNGPGNGPGFSLKGRSAKTLPAPDFNNVTGKVVVRIKVDPTGKVVDAEAISKGSTIASSKVWKKCEEYALKSKFSAKPDAPEVQQGTITYFIE